MERTPARSGSLLERQMSIIETVMASPDGLYLNEIADGVGLPKPTAHRMINSLLETGLLAYRGGGRKVYVMGPRVARMLHSGAEIGSMRRTVSPVLREVVDQLHETTFLARLNGLEVGAIAMMAPDSEGRGYVDPGRTLVPHAAASAKAIVAFQPPELVDRILRQPLKRFTPYTVTDVDAVRQDFERVRARGYAVCEREINLGIVAYACPNRLEEIGVLYSVGVTGPLEEMKRIPTESIIAVLEGAAERIGGLLSQISNPDHRRPWDREL